MIALVLRSTGSWYQVCADDGTMLECRIRGKLRLDGVKETNPVAVGDRVEIDEITRTIMRILPRRNHIVRSSTRKKGHGHVLAANIDQALMVATLSRPRTSLGFIDRFLLTCEAFEIPQIVVFNKSDLLDDDDREMCAAILDIYGSLGIRTFLISAKQDAGLDALIAELRGKTTLFAGHSGTGKSTLLNRLVPAARQSVGDISDYSEKGVHTTTFAEMFRMDPSTWLIDTPGVKEWGLLDIAPEEISGFFPEMRALRSDCRFGARCLHLDEPHCAVRLSVEEGRISASRYQNYVSMVIGEDNRK